MEEAKKYTDGKIAEQTSVIEEAVRDSKIESTFRVSSFENCDVILVLKDGYKNKSCMPPPFQTWKADQFPFRPRMRIC